MASQTASWVRAAAFRSQCFSLAKSFLDRVQVGRVFRRGEEPGAGGADGVADRGRPCASRGCPRRRCRRDGASAPGPARHRAGSSHHRSGRRGAKEPRPGRGASAARKVMVFQWPCGTAAFSRSPRGAQPRSGAMLVLVQVSSMNTRRDGWESGPGISPIAPAGARRPDAPARRRSASFFRRCLPSVLIMRREGAARSRPGPPGRRQSGERRTRPHSEEGIWWRGRRRAS